MEFLQVFGFLFALAHIHLAYSFAYYNQAKWYDEYKECSYKRQSPIELSTDYSNISYSLPKLYFHNYNMLFPQHLKVKNNGHTIEIDLHARTGKATVLEQKIVNQILPQIYGASLHSDRYIAESIHFHWGSTDFHGSEHVIDNLRHSMEMHILHRNSKYNSVDEARKHIDGLAVTAFLFQAEHEYHDYFGLNSIIEVLDEIEAFNKTTEMKSFFNLASLIGDKLEWQNYFTYEGSLTTPPCSESVTWLVSTDIIKMSHSQMVKFHEIRDENHQVVENNYRSLQARGSRVVTLRKSLEDQ